MAFARVVALLVMVGSFQYATTQRSGKVSFPEQAVEGRPVPAPSAASSPVQAESRLLADANGSFGLSGSGSNGQARNFGLELPGGPRRQDCPLCDVSVFSYCDDKLLHDACCCQPPQQLPPQCREADCRFLHAKSCYEHRLITRCCCNARGF